MKKDEGLGKATRTAQEIELLFELADELRIRVFVDNGLVLDFLSLVSIPQCAERLIVVGRRDGCNHCSLGVTANTVLQQPCQDLGTD